MAAIGQESASMSRDASRPLPRSGKALRGAPFYILMILLAGLFMFPFFWTVTSSLKQVSEIYTFPPAIFPSVPQFRNYAVVFQKVPYFRWVANSAFVVLMVTSGAIVTSSFVAYSFARFKYRGRDLLFIITLGTMMLPSQVTLIPQFVLFNALGWINSLYPLWVPAWFGGGAFNIFLMRQFILSLPQDLDEAALIDGASYFRVFWNVLMPLCKPALATMAILAFIGSWNDFVEPLIYINSRDLFTVAVGLNFFRYTPEQSGQPMEHLLMAASVMTTIPCLVVFFSAQRYFVRGIVLSGLKV